MALGGALLNLGLGLRQGTQAVFASGNLGGYIHPVGHGLGVAALGQRQQGLHLLAQLRFDLVGVCP